MEPIVQTTSHDNRGATDLAPPRRGDPRLQPSPKEKAAETRRRRREERDTQAWLGRLGMLTDEPPHDRTFWFRTFEISNVDVEAALEQAIAEVRTAMAPLTPEEIASERAMGVDPRPLEYDVAITHGGKILVVIQASDDGPIVTSLRTAAQSRQA